MDETGIKLRWKKFKWMILGARRDGLPYPMRYFGLSEDGMKHKGVIRRNMPNLVKDFLQDTISLLSRAETCNDIRGLRSNVIETLRKYERRALNGEPQDYVIWVKGVPYIRGIRGFYDARSGFKGRDVTYYVNYLKRTTNEVFQVVWE